MQATPNTLVSNNQVGMHINSHVHQCQNQLVSCCSCLGPIVLNHAFYIHFRRVGHGQSATAAGCKRKIIKKNNRTDLLEVDIVGYRSSLTRCSGNGMSLYLLALLFSLGMVWSHHLPDCCWLVSPVVNHYQLLSAFLLCHWRPLLAMIIINCSLLDSSDGHRERERFNNIYSTCHHQPFLKKL